MAKKTVIETLVVELTTDNSKFNRGMKSLTKSLTNTSKAMTNFGRRWSKIATSALLLVGVAATKLGKDYDMAMNRVRAVTQATAEDMQKLSDTALHLGRTTARSARQIAHGMETLGLAGFSTQEIEDSIGAVTSLSVISQQEMSISAQNAANIMSQFGIEATDLAYAVDQLAVTATSSNQTVEDLINGLKFAGPIANQAGLSLSETAAAMGILANNGIRAGIGGRALRMGILKLIAPTGQAAEEMERLNIKVTDMSGEILPFNDILSNVNAGLMGLSDAERMATLRTLFGTRALGPMNILLAEQAQLTEDGSNAFLDYANSIENSVGAAANMEDILLTGLPGATILFKSALEGALLSLREVFDTEVEAILRWLTGLFNAFSDLELGRSVILDYITDLNRFGTDVSVAIGMAIEKIDTFVERLTGIQNASDRVTSAISNKWMELISSLEETFGLNLTGEFTRGAMVDLALLVAAIGPVIFALGQVVGVIASLSSSFGGLVPVIGTVIKVFAGFINPTTLVVAAIGGLFYALLEFGEGMEDFKTRIGNTFVAVQGYLGQVGNAFEELWVQLKETGDALWAEFKERGVDKLLAELGTALVETLGSMIHNISQQIIIALKVLTWLVDVFTEYLLDPFTTLATQLIPVVTSITETLGNFFSVLGHIFAGDFDLALKELEEFTTSFLSIFVNWGKGLANVWESIYYSLNIDDLVTLIVDGFNGLVSAVDTALTTFGTNTKTKWNDLWTGVRDFFVDTWMDIREFFRDTWIAIETQMLNEKAFWGKFWEDYTRLFNTGIEGIRDFFIGTGDAIARTFGKIGEAITNTIDSFFTTMDDWNTAFEDFFKSLPSTIGNALTSVGTAISRFFAGLWNDITNGLSQQVTGALNSIIDIINEHIIQNVNKIGITVGGERYGINVDEIDNIGEGTGSVTSNSGYSGVPMYANGGFVKARPGGQLALIGEGRDDEVVSPIPMLQKLLREAISQSAMQVAEMYASNERLVNAQRSMGTATTPMAGAGLPQNAYNFDTQNTFNISGDYATKIKQVLEEQELRKRLALRGFKN